MANLASIAPGRASSMRRPSSDRCKRTTPRNGSGRRAPAKRRTSNHRPLPLPPLGSDGRAGCLGRHCTPLHVRMPAPRSRADDRCALCPPFGGTHRLSAASLLEQQVELFGECLLDETGSNQKCIEVRLATRSSAANATKRAPLPLPPPASVGVSALRRIGGSSHLWSSLTARYCFAWVRLMLSSSRKH